MRVRRVAGALAVLLAVSSCGGGDSAGDKAATGRSTSTSAAVTTTTIPAEIRTSRALALVPDDLGAGWKVHTPAVGAEEAGDQNCARREGALTGLRDDGRSVGAILQRGDAKFFVTSVTFAYADEPAAVAAVAKLKGESYQQCGLADLNANEQQSAGHAEGASWRISNVGDAQGEGEHGFELQIDYQYQATIDGKLQDGNGVYQAVVYRLGPNLAIYTVQAVAADSDGPDLRTTAFTEFGQGIEKAQERAAKG
jgi:hypothetical protein